VDDVTPLTYVIEVNVKNAGPVGDLSTLEMTELLAELVEAGLETYVRAQPWVLSVELMNDRLED
jgi:hypothetical protein